MKSIESKIFGIGLSKTGTTSLARALEMLGYRTKDNLGVINYRSGDLSSIDTCVLDTYEAFTDTPIPSFYQELDRKYPNSKFILTIRDENGWLKSCRKQFTKRLADKQNQAHNELFMDLYGCTVFNEEKFLNGYRTFFNNVHDYFKDRHLNLLILNVSAGEGWEKLCPFLGKPIPTIPFPKANVTQVRWLNTNNLVSLVQEAGKEALTACDFMQGTRPLPSTRVMGLFRKPRYIPRLVRYRLSRDKLAALKTATVVAENIISESLSEINPHIPIISPSNGFRTPYLERRGWNHFWLIDPLNIIDGSPQTGQNFTVSIALIEDRTPFLGIVYAPRSDTVYYGMKGKGSYKMICGGEPSLINGEQDMNTGLPSFPTESTVSSALHNGDELKQSNITLKICFAAESESRTTLSFTNSMEWEIAGAHAVVSSVGMRVVTSGDRRELTYNKEEFKNSSILIEPT